MRRLSSVLGTVAFCFAVLAAPKVHALDTKKFSAKSLEADYKLPIYVPKGTAPVGNEVVEDVNDVEHKRNAVYSLNGKLEKALDFYKAAMGEAVKKDDGDAVVYVFTQIDKDNPKIRRRVKVHVDPESNQVQVSLTVQEFSAAADAN
jgi:hypothetical protein